MCFMADPRRRSPRQSQQQLEPKEPLGGPKAVVKAVSPRQGCHQLAGVKDGEVRCLVCSHECEVLHALPPNLVVVRVGRARGEQSRAACDASFVSVLVLADVREFAGAQEIAASSLELGRGAGQQRMQGPTEFEGGFRFRVYVVYINVMCAYRPRQLPIS